MVYLTCHTCTSPYVYDVNTAQELKWRKWLVTLWEAFTPPHTYSPPFVSPPPLNNSFFMQLFFFPSSPQYTVVKHIDKQTKNGPRKRKVRQWLNSRSTLAFCNNRSHPSQACFFKAYQQANTRKEPCSLLENPTQLRHAKVLLCEDCTHLFMVDSSITTLPLPAWNGEEGKLVLPCGNRLCACGRWRWPNGRRGGVCACVCALCPRWGTERVCRRGAGFTVWPPMIPAKWCANLAAERRKWGKKGRWQAFYWCWRPPL